MPAPPHTRVLLADRPGFGRTALALLVRDTPGVTLVAKLAETALIGAAVAETRTDVVVVDDRLLRDQRWPGLAPGVRLIVVGVDDDPAYAARAQRLGAEAWVPKERADALLPLLVNRLEAVHP